MRPSSNCTETCPNPLLSYKPPISPRYGRRAIQVETLFETWLRPKPPEMKNPACAGCSFLVAPTGLEPATSALRVRKYGYPLVAIYYHLRSSDAKSHDNAKPSKTTVFGSILTLVLTAS